MNREDWGNLAAFALVAEERSFTRAAARLGVSPSALSHSIRILEESMGVRLLARSTRSVATTDAGERLLERLRPALDDISQAWSEVGQLAHRPAGHIRISSTRYAAAKIIGPVLPKFAVAYPEISVEVLIEPGFTDIIAQRFDAGVRFGESVAKDMISARISRDQIPVVVASPDYFRTNPIPTSPHALRSHRCIGFRHMAAGVVYRWEFEKERHKLDLSTDWSFVFNDEDMMIDAALAGVGVTYVFEDMVSAHLQSGALVRVLEDWCAPTPGYFLYYPSRRQQTPALAALIKALRVDRDGLPA